MGTQLVSSTLGVYLIPEPPLNDCRYSLNPWSRSYTLGCCWHCCFLLTVENGWHAAEYPLKEKALSQVTWCFPWWNPSSTGSFFCAPPPRSSEK